MVTVRITETYDMKTTKDKLGVIGIHTPTGSLVRRLYPGLVKNYRFMRMKKCDVVGACASVLPADPLQVGVSAGEVAPEDMFNPILYKAVSNTSFETLVSRIYQTGNDLVNLNSVSSEDLDSSLGHDAFKTYYAMLAENNGWRKAMPQAGFRIRNLVPLAHTLVSTFGNVSRPGNIMVKEEDPDYPGDLRDVEVADVASVDSWSGGNNTTESGVTSAITFRGKTVKMPRVPLHYGPEDATSIPEVNYPKTFVACLVTPPARLHEFYYRMRVTWTVSFEGLITSNEVGGPYAWNSTGNLAYARSYTFPSSKVAMENSSDSVDADNVSIDKIMES